MWGAGQSAEAHLARAKGSLKLVLGSAWLTQTGEADPGLGVRPTKGEEGHSFSLVLYLTNEEHRRSF